MQDYNLLFFDDEEKEKKFTFDIDVFSYHDFPLYVHAINGDTSVAMHSHSYTELVIIFAGAGWHGTPSDKRWFTAGDVFLISKDGKHYYKDSENINMANILFDLPLLQISLYDLPKIPGYQLLFGLGRKDQIGYSHLNQEKLIEVRQLVEHLSRACKSSGAGMQTLAVSYLLQLLLLVCKNVDESHEKQNSLDYNLGRVVSHIEGNYRNKITLDELADLANMSRRNFQRIFKNTFGISPIDYLLNLRLNKSRNILRRFQTLSISKVASLVGFSDSNYFAKKFKLKFGYPPTLEKG